MTSSRRGSISPRCRRKAPCYPVVIQLAAIGVRARRQSDALARHHDGRAWSVEDIPIEAERGMRCRLFRLDRPGGYMTLRLRASGPVMFHSRLVENIAVERINRGIGLLLALSVSRR